MAAELTGGLKMVTYTIHPLKNGCTEGHTVSDDTNNLPDTFMPRKSNSPSLTTQSSKHLNLLFNFDDIITGRNRR